MELDNIAQKLKEIGLYEINELKSKISINPKYIYLEFMIDFEVEVFGENCEDFWDFYKEYCCDGSIEYLTWNIPTNIKIVFLYENGTLKAINKNPIKETHFYKFLEEGLIYYLNEIMAKM